MMYSLSSVSLEVDSHVVVVLLFPFFFTNITKTLLHITVGFINNVFTYSMTSEDSDCSELQLRKNKSKGIHTNAKQFLDFYLKRK